MRNPLLLALFFLACLTWAVAQNRNAPSQSAPAGTAGQSASPNSAGAQAQPPAGTGNSIVEGCLAGSAPNFTVTDAAGTVYNLQFPQSADVSIIAKHIGESVQVAGKVNSSTSTSTTAAAGDPPGRSIQVMQMGTSNAHCSGAGAGAGAAGTGAGAATTAPGMGTGTSGSSSTGTETKPPTK